MRCSLASLLCVLMFAACQSSTSEEASINVPFDPAERIESGSRISASIVRRIGSENGEQDMLGQPLNLHVDSDGHIHVLDSRLREIKVFRADGTVVMTHSIPEGEGPGEASRARSLTLAGDEDAYFMYDVNQMRVTILDREFEVLNAFSPRHRPLTLTNFGDDLILGAVSQMMVGGDSLLHVWGLDGTHLRSFLQRHPLHETLVNDPQFGWAPTNAIASSGDRIFVAYGFPLDLEFYAVESDGIRLVKRYYRDYTSDTAYRGDLYRAQSGSGSEYDYPKYYAAAVCANDRYVIRVILDSEDERAYFDVYDRDGAHVGIVDLSEQLGLESITSCFSSSISDDNIVYGPSYERGFPEILAIQLDLP